VLYDTVGPVTVRGDAAQMPVTAAMIATGATYSGSKVARKGEWAYILNALAKDIPRNDLIRKWMLFDALEYGRKILLLSDRRQWCLDQVEWLNRQDVAAEAVLGGMTSKKAKAARDETIKRMMDGKTDVIAATQVFKAGADVPCLDTLYVIFPMNNIQQLDQMLGRIRRWYDGKQYPLVRVFVDGGHGMLYGCARGTHKHLVELGADVILVPEGVEPYDVLYGAGFNPGAKAKRGKKGLRGAARRNPDAVTKLFDDLQKATRQQQRYKDRMKGKKT
jgi:superfamily II DNA or RNA helicase